MPKDFNAEQLAEQDWLKPVTAFAESRKADLPPPVDPVLDTLVKARKRLANPKNWQKREGRLGEATCALGACYDASRQIDGRTRLGSTAVDLLQSFIPPGFIHVPHYNDDPATTHADVLALFDRAIAARKGA